MSRLILLSLAVAALSLSVQAAAVKDKPAAGYGPAPQDPYYPPAPVQQPNYYQVPVFVPPPAPPLVHSHVCQQDVGYATYGGKHYRSRHPKERTCDDIYLPTGSGSNRKTANKNCNRCCMNAARLNGITTDSITGMILIEDDKRRCTCCAPALTPGAAQPLYGAAAAAPAVGYGAYPSADVQQPATYSQPPAAASPPATGY